ncbi:MAG TPA: 16S rRNA pseudouridine(516) synthase [Methylophilaceae bacterium]|nr:16S rRNA pseudouridine(516) synthase [Methylophilaceae bacterium]
MQLERILHRQGFGSRKLCRILILNGQVTVNGASCDDPAADFDTTDLRFTVEGLAWQYREQAYLMLHKPAHYECSHKTLHHPSIYRLLPVPLVERGVQCIGRLDEDTTGLILLSDDGQFIHRMSSPKWKVPKVYEVTTKHAVDARQVQALLEGVLLVDESETIAALACSQVSDHVIHLTLAEGKYHQVKRMLAAVGNRVEALKRIRIGALELPAELAPGEWRWLDETDMEKLRGERLPA